MINFVQALESIFFTNIAIGIRNGKISPITCMSLLPGIMTIIKLESNFRHFRHFRFIHNFPISDPYQYSIKNLRLFFEAGTNFSTPYGRY